jgi:hypothetical protein
MRSTRERPAPAHVGRGSEDRRRQRGVGNTHHLLVSRGQPEQVECGNKARLAATQ